ncbi:MAG: multidrug transporter subunit MdtD [Betaproteobacteria bacterium]|nr:multidrug transporter subunit MdtD [Betaproteobacteria bacterium]
MNPQILPPERRRPLQWLVAVGFFMQTLDGTIVNTALPAMAHDLAVSPFRMEAVVIAYMLTVALLMPASGWLADRYGTRRIFMTAIVLFTLGSLACAESHTLTQLTASRVLQGIGGAMLVPVGRLAILRGFPRSELLSALSFVIMPALVGPLIGPTLGGWLTDIASWHWIFLINLPVGVLGLLLTGRYMPAFTGERIPFDWIGFGLFGVGIAVFSLSIEGVGELGFSPARALLLAVFGLGCLAAYWLHAMRTAVPLFNPRLFHTNSFSVGIIGNLFARLSIGGIPFLMPQLLQVGLGISATNSGLMLVPVAIASILSKPLIEPAVQRFGYRRMLTVNTALVGCSIMGLATIGPNTPLWLILFQLFVMGGINGMQFSLMNTLTLKDLNHTDASAGNSLLSVIQQLSMSLGVGTAAMLLSAFLTTVDRSGADGDAAVFHPTYFFLGLLALVATTIFLQLDPAQDRSGTRSETRDSE